MKVKKLLKKVRCRNVEDLLVISDTHGNFRLICKDVISRNFGDNHVESISWDIYGDAPIISIRIKEDVEEIL